MKSIIRTGLLVGLLMIVLAGCNCKHEWTDATCTAPKTCQLCNEVEGEALEHNWEDATCTAQKICTLCAETEGTALPHIWEPATCKTPKTCRLCGGTQGVASEHTAGEWETSSTDMVAAVVTYKRYCTVCGDQVDRKTTSLKQLHDGEHFLISPKQFVERLGNQLDEISGNTLETRSGMSGDTFVCGIVDDGKKVGAILFTEGDGAITAEQRNDVCFNKMLGTVDDQEAGARVLLALIRTCDPAIDFDAAKELGKDASAFGSVTENGVTYVAMISDDSIIIGVTLEE